MILDSASLFKIEEVGIKYQECNKDEVDGLNLSDKMNFLNIMPMDLAHKISNLIILRIFFSGYV